MLRVNRGDGIVFRMREQQYPVFKRRNPGAFVVSAPSLEPAKVEADTPGLMSLTVARLHEIAEAAGVAVPVGPKAAIVAALAEAGITEEPEA